MILVKEHMFLIIHTEDVWLVPLIKNYMKDLFGLDPEQLFFYPKKSTFIHFVHHDKTFYDRYVNTDDRKSILMMMGVEFFQNRRIESFTIKNIIRHMEIDVMLFPLHI